MSTETHIYSVPDISCDHCVEAITNTVTPLPGVKSLTVNVAAKQVTVVGGEDEAIVKAIDEAGYDVA